MNQIVPLATSVVPFSLKDAPSLIEKAWPTSKISAETQKERKAVHGQTLTGLGSYWKGRKPLILTRACVLATLLPATDDLERDVAIFEKLMGFDDQGMLRRLPRGKQALLGQAAYGDLVLAAKRPEELAETELLEGIWDEVNDHLGTQAFSIAELVEQLGIMRYGRRPKLADTFSGSGSIPFEAARIGCDVYASDLNPIACMLTWGAFNIVGASAEDHTRMKAEQERIVAEIDAEICSMGIEHDSAGNRAKVYLYCLETRCPRTGWMVPMAPSWVISKARNVIARLVPNEAEMRYDMLIETGVDAEAMAEAEQGTVRKGRLYHPMLDDPLGIAIKEIRGDYKDEHGDNQNRLRKWEIHDFKPRADDIWQERLYAIQWLDAEDLAAGKANPRTWFAAPTAEDMERERIVEGIVEDNLAVWQAAGIVPDMEIEPGYNTSQPIRERGWTHWHHLFNPRHLLVNATAAVRSRRKAQFALGLARLIDRSGRLTHWLSGGEQAKSTFANQALNTMWNYPARSWSHAAPLFEVGGTAQGLEAMSERYSLRMARSSDADVKSDVYLTDPPYADAVQYDEITEFFIAWLRKDPPAEFADWVWDSRRNLAIKGEGQGFKAAMVEAYGAMTRAMSNNGLQIVQFTHQDGKVWSDMAQIFWGAGLQVVQDWYVSTETMTELKKGGYVQGTHMIVLKKRQGEKSGYSDEITHEIREEVARQVAEMVGLNQSMTGKGRDENIFNDADLQMAGYAAALRVLTAYTHIDGVDMRREALRPRKKGEATVVDDLVDFAVQVANELLVPEGLPQDVWLALTGPERFYLKMADLEEAGAVKLDQFQNFAKAFKATEFGELMASKSPNDARLKTACEFGKKHFTDGQAFGRQTLTRQVLYAVWKLSQKDDADLVIEGLRGMVPDYHRKRPQLISLADYLARKWEAGNDAEALQARVLRDAIQFERI